MISYGKSGIVPGLIFLLEIKEEILPRWRKSKIYEGMVKDGSFFPGRWR